MEETLLEDLISYRKSKDKGVCAASRGLLALYREVNPAMLKKKERGKMGSLAVQEGKAAAPFGVDQEEIKGIKVSICSRSIWRKKKHVKLPRWRRRRRGEDADDKGWEGWEEESEEDSDGESEDGWINVSSDDEDGVLRLSDSDSDDDEETRKHKRTVKERLLAAVRRGKSYVRVLHAERNVKLDVKQVKLTLTLPIPSPPPTTMPLTIRMLRTTRTTLMLMLPRPPLVVVRRRVNLSKSSPPKNRTSPNSPPPKSSRLPISPSSPNSVLPPPKKPSLSAVLPATVRNVT